MPFEFDPNSFAVAPNGNNSILSQDSGILPAVHTNYVVQNIGRAEIYANVKYGTAVNWFGDVINAFVQPGERKVLEMSRPYYITELKLYNNTNIRAIAHCSGGNIITPALPPSFDYNSVLKEAFAAGVKFIPYVGSALSGLVKAFWPENKKNVWEEIKDKIFTLLDDNTLNTVNGILDGDLRYYKDRINTLIDEMKTSRNVSVHYMNIAQDLVGFENKFTFSSAHPDHNKINFYLLPLYSNFVLMKLGFYTIGISNQDEIGLSNTDVADIGRYASRTIRGDNGAENYIKSMFKERVDNAYNTSFPGGLYSNIMTVRTHISIHGLEYLPIWNFMLDNPSSPVKVYNDVISYSQFFGRQTANLIAQATPEQLSQPFTPKLINGKRNLLKTVKIFIWRINNGNGPARIGGLRLTFQNGDSYTMGSVSGESDGFDLDSSYIVKVRASGLGAIDNLTFYLSDGRNFSYGVGRPDSYMEFELKGHKIVSLFLANDSGSLGGQASTVAVSYQLLD